MIGNFDVWGMLAGVSLFLFAMGQLESALHALGGRNLSKFLRRRTDSPMRGVLGGIVATAFLQSSSVVSLMVLAFVGAGMLALPSALAIVFGSNLGTTLTGWLVASLGFRFDINDLALPLIAVGGLLSLAGRGRWAEIGRVVIGLGILLLGLQFMKSSVSSLTDYVELDTLADLAPWQYLSFGVIFAAVIQSSSATLMITLAALNAGIITLPNAAAIAIGADLGTTTTVIIGAIRGAPAKRQVATAHFLFNLVTDGVAYVLRVPLLVVIAWVGIADPLFALVAFHSLFNLIGLAIFAPLIKPFARFLEHRFVAGSQPVATALADVNAAVSDAALMAIETETAHLIGRVIDQSRAAFSPTLPLPPGRAPVDRDPAPRTAEPADYEQMYARTKRLEGEILAFTTRLQAESLDREESERLERLLRTIREAVHSAKSLKDIRHNLDAFYASGDEVSDGYLDHFRGCMNGFLADLYSLRHENGAAVSFEDLVAAAQSVRHRHDELHARVFADIRTGAIRQTDVSSLLNVNREILNSNLALSAALSSYHLDAAQADAFSRLPGAE